MEESNGREGGGDLRRVDGKETEKENGRKARLCNDFVSLKGIEFIQKKL